MALEVRDVLVTIREFLLDGIETSYAKCSPNDKTSFIESCQYLVMHGWQGFVDESGSSFFLDKMPSILVSPKEKLFLTNPNVTAADVPLIKVFGRYCLLRALFDMVAKNKIELTAEEKPEFKRWFLEAVDKLDEDFKNTPREKKVLKYGNIPYEVESIEKLNEMILEKETELKDRYANVIIFAGYGLAFIPLFYLAQYVKKTPLIIGMCCLSLLARRYMNTTESLTNLHQFFKDKAKFFIPSAASSKEVAKYAMISRDAVEKYFSDVTLDVQQTDTSSGLSKRIMHHSAMRG